MYDEDIRNKISFDPLKSGGASFETKILIKSSNHKLIFKHTRSYVLFSSTFILIPFIIISVIFYKNYESSILDVINDNIIIFLVTFIFIAVSSYLFYDLLKPIVFDKSINRFYKGYNRNVLKKTKNNIPLNRIVGIQLIGEIVKGDKSSYKSYEINLILDNFTRILVIDHGNGEGIVQDAKAISHFLNVPIWYKNKDNSLVKQESK